MNEPCPACGSAGTRARDRYNGYALAACDDCGFTFTVQRNFPVSQYQQVYSEVLAYKLMLQDAHETHSGQKGFKDLWWFKRKALAWLSRTAPQGSLLDIGSGPGTFLMVARDRYGYRVQGVEPASTAAEVANSFEVPTFSGTVETFAAQHRQKFDAISLFEVLEHVSDPVSLLACAKGLLKPGGALVISVPNLDDPYCLKQEIPPAMPPIHINFFCRRSLAATLDRAGFDVAKHFSLPVPTSSVRNVHGTLGWALRLTYLAAGSLLGKADGTTLLTLAVHRETVGHAGATSQ